MIKSMTAFKRRPGLTVEAFDEYWRSTHAELAVQLPGLRHYRQNPVTAGAYRDGREPVFDGVAEVWFDDTEALRAVAASDAYRTLMADEPNLMDMGTRTELLVDEHVIIDRPEPPDGLKFMTFVRKRPDLDVDTFQAYWLQQHGPLVTTNPHLARYTQNHLRRRFYDDGRTPTYDGVAVVWFAGPDELRASATSPELAAIRADEANFLADAGVGLPFLIVRERVVVA
jgi:uncharacterized protein (TIGR02118 family)